jgi:hypothetical protein
MSQEFKKSFKNIKINFEKKHFKIMNPISFAEEAPDKSLIIRNKSELCTAYDNLHYVVMKKTTKAKTYTDDEEVETQQKLEDKKFIQAWLQDEGMRTYDYIDFLHQQQAPRNVYNTFNGFASESIKKPKKEIDIVNSLMMKHIKNLCNNEEKVYSYVLKFLGRKVQKPYLLTRTALLFKGAQGCGKDYTFRMVRE